MAQNGMFSLELLQQMQSHIDDYRKEQVAGAQ
jgi:hypothetical protein